MRPTAGQAADLDLHGYWSLIRSQAEKKNQSKRARREMSLEALEFEVQIVQVLLHVAALH